MQTIKAENLADAVMEGLKDYARLATDDLKAAERQQQVQETKKNEQSL